MADRVAEPGGAFVAQAAKASVIHARATHRDHRPDADRGLPAGAVRDQRHAGLPGRGRPADAVRRPRGAVAAAVPDVRAGPPTSAAVAGGGGQVLPARRVRLGDSAVRHRAALRLQRQPAAGRHRVGQPGRRPVDLLLLGGIALLVVGLLFKGSVGPFHTWTPDVYQGAPTPITAFMGACTKVAAFAAMIRVFYMAFAPTLWDWRATLWAVAIASMLIGAILGITQTDVKRMLAYSSVAHAGFLLLGVIALTQAGDVGDVLLSAHLRLRDHRRARAGHAGPQRGRRGRPGVAVGRPGQAVADAGRADDAVPAVVRRYTADQRLHRQAHPVQRRDRRRNGSAGGGRDDRHRDHRVLLPEDRRADVLLRAAAGRPGRHRAARR